MANIIGDNQANVLNGTAEDDTIDGFGGDDVITGLAGDDTLTGGAGDDVLDGGTGADTLNGGEGSDTLVGDLDDAYIDGGTDEGIDFARLNYAAATTDLFVITGNGQAFSTPRGLVRSIERIDLVSGTGNDTIYAGEYDDTVDAGAGNDFVDGRGGVDDLDGGTGTDTMRSFSDAGTTSDIVFTVAANAAGSAYVAADGGRFVNFEAVELTTGSGDDTLTGGALADIFNGGEGDDVITGLAGDDTLTGGAGDDVLDGGTGADTLNGGEGSDTLVGDLDDAYIDGGTDEGIDFARLNYAAATTDLFVITGNGQAFSTPRGLVRSIERIDLVSGTGNDTIYAGEYDDTVDAGAGNDFVDGRGGVDDLDGGTGTDTMRSFSDAGTTSDIVFTVAANAAGSAYVAADGGRFVNFEAVELTTGSGDDTLTGGALADIFNGGEGDDVITGLAGDDTLTGGAGDDVLDGGTGADTLNGGEGSDTLVGDLDDAYIDGGTDEGIDFARLNYAAATTDLFVITGNGQAFSTPRGLVRSIERIDLVSGTGNDTIYAGEYDDTVDAGAGNDFVDGRGGIDDLDGGTGDDTLTGGANDDVLTGGDGADVAIYSGLFADYEVTSLNGVVTVRDTRTNGDGADTLSGIERAQFSDQTIDLLTNRSPEVEGPNLFTTVEDSALTFTQAQILVNDRDPDGDPLTISAVRSSAGGTALLNDDGTITFTPGMNFNGEASFLYTVIDGEGGLAEGTVTITVTPVNDMAIAADDGGYETAFGTPVTITAATLLGNDSDVDGDVLTIATVGSATGGTVAINQDGDVVFTPAAGFSGAASFTYRASDGQVQSNSATVQLTVAPATNAEPVGIADSYTIDEDSVLTDNVLANDVDVDRNALTATLVDSTRHGSVSLNADGTFVYTPNADFSGDDSFSYRVSDGTLTDGPVTVSITVAPVNDAPLAFADAGFATDFGTAFIFDPAELLANDVDEEGDTLTLTAVDGATAGTVTLDSEGRPVFTPTPGYSGVAGFSYTVIDGEGGTASATVTLTVRPPVNTAPIATDDSFSLDEETSVSGSVLPNDFDADGDALSTALVSGPANGTLELNADGTFLYTPDRDYFGEDSFTYAVSDGETSAEAIVTLTIRDVAELPASEIVERAGTENGSSAADELLTGPAYRNSFYFDQGVDTGDDLIVNFGKSDVVATNGLLKDADSDGIITLPDSVLSLGGALDNSVTINGVTALRYLGTDGSGVHAYSNASVQPRGAIEGKIGDETLSGDTANARADTFFFDTALDLDLGRDTIRAFGSSDVLVLTSKLFDSNGDDIITFGGNRALDLSGAINGPGDPGSPGEGGSLLLFTTSGRSVRSVEFDGSIAHDGVDYYVYSLIGSPAGVESVVFG